MWFPGSDADGVAAQEVEQRRVEAPRIVKHRHMVGVFEHEQPRLWNKAAQLIAD